MLFNVNIREFPFENIMSRLKNSSMEDSSVEEDIVNELELAISNFDDMYTEAEWALIRCRMFSGDNLFLPREFINASIVPIINATVISIDKDNASSIIGTVNHTNSEALYSSSFWQEQENVDINNTALSTSGLIDRIDTMVTREIHANIFLGKLPGETLSECFVEGVNGSIMDTGVPATRVINKADADRTFFLSDDVINSSLYSVEASDNFYISSNHIHIKKGTLSSPVFTGLTVVNGVETKSSSNRFIKINGILDKTAILPENEHNLVSREDIAIMLFNSKAPTTGWKSVDLARDGEIMDSDKVKIVEEVLTGISEDIGIRMKPIILSELKEVLETVTDRLINIGVCDD